MSASPECQTGRNHDPQPEHGTVYRYSCCKCRCDLCRRANADWQLWYYHGGRQEIADRGKKGCTRDYLSYGRGCRCGPCSNAMMDWQRAYRAAKKEAAAGVAS